MAGKKNAARLKKELRQLFVFPELPRLFDWKPLPRRRFHYARGFSRMELAPLLAALLLFAVTLLVPVGAVLKTVAFAAAALVAGFSALRELYHAALERHLPDEDALMLLASLLAFLSGHSAAGALIVLCARAGQLAEAYLLARAERGVEELSELLPEKAHLEQSFGVLDILPEKLNEGDIFLVEEGERVPTDGVVLSGESMLDASAIGGLEAQQAAPGDAVLSGSVNRGGTLRVRASAAFADSTLARQLRLIRRARRGKTALEDNLEAIAAWFAPVMLLLALFAGLILPLASLGAEGFSWEPYLLAASLFVLLASPSPLILSIPLIFQGGMCSAFRSGLYLRDKAALETLYHVKAVVFGKTGTVTDGRFRVLELSPLGVRGETLLHMAALVEGPFRHPIAEAIKEAANWTDEQREAAVGVEELPGCGVTAFVDGEQVLVGNAALLAAHEIECAAPERSGTAIHVAVGSRYWGYILVGDTVREGAFEALEQLRGAGVRSITLLTGDVRSLSAQLGRALNFDLARSELSPKEKLSAISFLRRSLGRGETLAYVGDGFHDEALFRKADLGIALKPTGESAAETAADLVLMDDDLMRVPAAMKLAVQLRRLILENLLLCCASRLVTLLFGLFGWFSLPTAALLTLLCAVLAMLNALRSFLIKEQTAE